MKERVSERVYRLLREDIFEARHDPNELIVERDVAAKYGVSKVTASEALHRLCCEGHLTSHPRSGYTVTLLSPAEIDQIKRLRLVLESLVIDILCAEAKDEDIKGLYGAIQVENNGDVKFASVNSKFHLKMARLTGDQYLLSTLENLLGALSRLETIISLNYRDKWSEWHEHHRRILDAVLARNAEEAKKRLRDDLDQ